MTHEDEDTETGMSSSEFSYALAALLDDLPLGSSELDPISKVRTYADSDLMTYDDGVLVTLDDGTEFQITIVRAS